MESLLVDTLAPAITSTPVAKVSRGADVAAEGRDGIMSIGGTDLSVGASLFGESKGKSLVDIEDDSTLFSDPDALVVKKAEKKVGLVGGVREEPEDGGDDISVLGDDEEVG